MSISLSYHRTSRDELVKITKSQSVWDAYRKIQLEAWVRANKEAMAELAKLPPLNDPAGELARLDALLEKKRDPKVLGLEKDWHTLAYLLTGSPAIKEEHIPGKPLHNIIFGGRKTSVTTGYGPVTFFDDPLVAESLTALKGIDKAIIGKRFDPAKMRELKIYAPPEPEEKDAIMVQIEKLSVFFEKAASAHEYVVKYST